MKKILYGFCVSAALLLTACGESYVSKTIAVSDVATYGKHKEYVKVVDDNYVLMYNNCDEYGSYAPTITITFELLKEVGELEGYEVGYGHIDIAFIDANGGVIGDCEFTPESSGYGKLDDLLQSGAKGDRVNVTFSANPSWYCDDEQEIAPLDKAVVSFEVNDLEFSEVYYVSSNSSSDDSSSSSESSSSSSSVSSTDWDEVIDEFDNYVDKYIAVIEKVNNGDMSAMADMGSMLQSANSLADKLSGAQGELTASQLSKYMGVTSKLAGAAVSMAY